MGSKPAAGQVPHCSLPQSLPLFGEPFPLPPVSELLKWKEAKVLIKQSRGSTPCHPTLGNRFLFVLLMGHPMKSFPWIKKPLNNGKLLYFKGVWNPQLAMPRRKGSWCNSSGVILPSLGYPPTHTPFFLSLPSSLAFLSDIEIVWNNVVVLTTQESRICSWAGRKSSVSLLSWLYFKRPLVKS